MSTSGAYGGSSSTVWTAVRDAWTGLSGDEPAGTDAGGDPADAPGGDPNSQPGQQDPSPYDELGRAFGRALGAGRAPAAAAPTLSALLRAAAHWDQAVEVLAGWRGGYSGRAGTRTSRVGAQQAARGGAAVGAGYAYPNRDGAALGQYGIRLAELDTLSVRMRCARLLDLVLGDAGHPDGAAVRPAAASSSSGSSTLRSTRPVLWRRCVTWSGTLPCSSGWSNCTTRSSPVARPRRPLRRRRTVCGPGSEPSSGG